MARNDLIRYIELFSTGSAKKALNKLCFQNVLNQLTPPSTSSFQTPRHCSFRTRKSDILLFLARRSSGRRDGLGTFTDAAYPTLRPRAWGPIRGRHGESTNHGVSECLMRKPSKEITANNSIINISRIVSSQNISLYQIDRGL